jgi:hypothetical protein
MVAAWVAEHDDEIAGDVDSCVAEQAIPAGNARGD